MADVVFARAGDHWVATELARGPWNPDHCHGGAPAALLAALVDATPAPSEMVGVRLTLELLRPVPLGPVVPWVEVTREGRRIQVLDLTLTAGDGTPLIIGRALRIRRATLDLEPVAVDETPPKAPEDLPRFAGHADWGTGFWTAMDVRIAEGDLGAPGVGAAWFRFDADLAEGVDLSPFARVAAAGDYGNGIGSPLEMGPWLYVNPDLTVAVHRPPVDDWVGIRARSAAEPLGTGLTTTGLFDRTGRIGTALQSLFVAPME
jgi:hypothetical protein